MPQIMLSVHCASLLPYAVQLRLFLIDMGYTVFLCSEMEAGVAYRTEICESALKCNIFVAFINHGWCKSKECEFEFNIALSSSLKSATRTPYIIPILLEEFSFYEDYPTVSGFLKNSMGITTKHTELGVPTWAQVVKTIKTHRELLPENPPSPALTHKQTEFPSTAPTHKQTELPTAAPTCKQTEHPTAAPTYKQAERPTPAPTQPAMQSRKPAPRSANATTGDSAQTTARSSSSPATSTIPENNEEPQVVPRELQVMVETAKQLLEDIINANQVQPYLKMLLRELVKPILENFRPSLELETALRVLMDYLGKIKEISSTIKDHQYLDALKIQVTKLAQMFYNANYSSVQEFIGEAETRKFWETHFGKTTYTTPWSNFVEALTSDPNYRIVRGDTEVEAMLQDLQMYLDHYNTGHVVCHRLSDFVGNEPLRIALQKYTQKPLQAQTPPSARPNSSAISYPLILWIDDNPEFNIDMVQYAQGNGVTVIPLKSTTEAKQWILEHPKVLEAKDKVRIITDNVRNRVNTTVLDLNAGEDIIRYVRSRRSLVPILVYCGNLAYTKYVANYKQCSATIEASGCQDFVEALFPNRAM